MGFDLGFTFYWLCDLKQVIDLLGLGFVTSQIGMILPSARIVRIE